jgi:hypothetical protein
VSTAISPAADLVDDWGGRLFHSPRGLYPFQLDDVAACYLNIVDGKSDTAMVLWDTGCIQGDAEIAINRAGKGSTLTLRDLVHRFNGGSAKGGKKWDPSIETYVQREVDGVIRLGKISNAWASGVK